MPTYEYECTKCTHHFEQFQAITAEPVHECPVCKGPTRRLIGRGAGIIFKGSGFYQTDYRSSSYQKKAEADKPAGKKPEPEKKSDSGKNDNSSSSAGSNPNPTSKDK